MKHMSRAGSIRAAKVESSVPLPEKGTVKKSRNPAYVTLINKMRIGDSVLLESEVARTFAECVRKHKLAKVITRSEGGKTRVWRVRKNG